MTDRIRSYLLARGGAAIHEVAHRFRMTYGSAAVEMDTIRCCSDCWVWDVTNTRLEHVDEN